MSRPPLPRVALDARHLHSGIGRYVENVALGLAELPERGGLEVCLLGDSPRLRRLAGATRFTVRPARSRLYSVGEQLELPRCLRGMDLFHATHYPIPWWYRGPLVVTVLDLNHLEPPRGARLLGRWLYARTMLARVMRRAQRVVAITHAVGERIVDRWPAVRPRLRVVHLSIGPEFAPVTDARALAACRVALELPERFVLVLGNLLPYKNVETVVRALADLREQPSLELVIAGEGATTAAPAVRLAAELGIGERVRALGMVAEEHLPALMSLARVGACPSYLEGFGLVPLEMLATGLPVVASSIPAHREVLGTAAELVSPGDVAGWSLALAAALAETGRPARIVAGRRVAAGFTRAAEATALLEVYREALAGG